MSGVGLSRSPYPHFLHFGENMINGNRILVIIVAICIVVGVAYYLIDTNVGYSTEIYGKLNLEDWTITTNANTEPKKDYNAIQPSSNADGIGFLQSDEVIVVVQIADKTFEQNLGTFDTVTNTTTEPTYNVFLSHLQPGEYDYTVFLYHTTGMILKSRIMMDQVDGELIIGE